MAGQTYNIGQIIYILSEKSQSVVPAIVAEEDIRKVRKLDGVHEVVNYKLCIGPKDRQRMVELSRITGEVYTSLEDIRRTLVDRLTDFVNGVIGTTEKNVQDWYGVTAGNQVLETANPANAGDKLDPEQIINAVNHNLPLSQQTMAHPLQIQQDGSIHPQQGINPHATMRDNIRNMVSPEEELLGPSVNDGIVNVIGPDGQRYRTKMNG